MVFSLLVLATPTIGPPPNTCPLAPGVPGPPCAPLGLVEFDVLNPDVPNGLFDPVVFWPFCPPALVPVTASPPDPQPPSSALGGVVPSPKVGRVPAPDGPFPPCTAPPTPC